jgi:fatty acid desaturase
MAMKIKDYLDQDQIKYFTAKSDVQALWLLLINWLGVFALFSMVSIWTNPLTIMLAIILLAGRMLGLSVLMHECGHRTFFKSAKVNYFVGQWLCATLTFNDLDTFANEHKVHHQKVGTLSDPNLENYRAYPVEKASFTRKMYRDITGRTGVKLIVFIINNVFCLFDKARRALAFPALKILWAQCLFAIVLGLLFAPWMYLIWLATQMTTFMVVVRIRQIAEHGAVPRLLNADPRENTRTTIPTWWERIVIAPNYVNYHVEHHFMSSVPCYKLKELHQLLKRKGAYKKMHIPQSYGEVVRTVIKPAELTLG